MGIISSRHNPLVKRIREAIREHADEIVIEGPKAVGDAIAGGWRALAVVERDVDLSHDVFDTLATTKSPQNVIGLFARPRGDATAILARRDTVVIALDGVQDPGNVGTIVRLAAAFDAAGVLLLPGCADPFGPKAIRASAGAILNVPVAEIATEELLSLSRPPASRQLFATAMSGSVVDPPARDAVLVFGNEGTGVSAEVLQQATKLAIPMTNRVESLNVATSAAILLAQSFSRRAEVRAR